METKNNEKYYLVVNGEVFAYSEDYSKLVDYITGFNLHTQFYGESIDSQEKYQEYFDWHSGLWSCFDVLLNKDGETADCYIIEEFYVNQYPDIFKLINEFRKTVSLSPLTED